jgi:hypothetical protein
LYKPIRALDVFFQGVHVPWFFRFVAFAWTAVNVDGPLSEDLADFPLPWVESSFETATLEDVLVTALAR